jgi:hypothetical protein
MILTTVIIGLLIFTAIWFGLDDIKTELSYRNNLLEEQNELLKRQNDIIRRKKRKTTP